MPDVALSIGTAVVAAAVVMTVTALVARRQGRVVVVDTAWGLGFVVIAVSSAALATAVSAGDGLRTALLVAIVAVWGLRLGWHVHRRSSAPDGLHRGEDPRYLTVLGGPLSEVGMGVAVRKVFGVQGLVMTVIALPVAVGMVSDDPCWPVVVAGLLVWLTGVLFESIGDAQLAAYRSLETRPAVLDSGLWGWTRHPNYFGDACVWWGIWLVGGLASGWVIGLATVIAPIAMTWFLVQVTGVKLLEQTMMKRPAYVEYASRTPRFIPRPPRGRHVSRGGEGSVPSKP